MQNAACENPPGRAAGGVALGTIPSSIHSPCCGRPGLPVGDPAVSWARVAPFVLLLLGLAQIAGDLAGFATLKGIAAASQASPAPKVFSAVRGLETYSSRFFLEWTDLEGHAQSLELTADVYQQLRGPYNRRNDYVALVRPAEATA